MAEVQRDSVFGTSGVSYVAKGEAKLSYQPPLAPPECGFGPYECHPQLVERATPEGSIEMAHNGEWLIVSATVGAIAVTKAFTDNPRDVAERQCVVWNKGKPTRVVDLFGHQLVSVHSYDALCAQLRASGSPTVAPEDI